MASIFKRLIRRPQKYLRRDFWVPTLAEFRSRARNGIVFAAPTIVRRRLRAERPLCVYLFPLPMNHFQLAETYVAWKVLWQCNVRTVLTGAEHADIALAWHPATNYTADDLQLHRLEPRMRVINGRCTDIRKSVVDSAFAEVFGYSLAVDPRTYHGAMLWKSEKNGAHDGRIVEGPVDAPDPQGVYQRLISYETVYGMCEWRTFIVGRKPVAVYASYRPVDDRFTMFPYRSELTTVNETFTKREQQLIAAFCERMHLDFGALDILRDIEDGRMYICDCNNTPTGPSPTSLSIRNQLRVVHQISDAFEREYLAPLRAKTYANEIAAST